MTEQKTGQTELTINYLKSHSFREVSCDGVIGGATPRGKLWCAFFTERFALPKVVKYPIDLAGVEDGFELDENERRVIEAKERVVRNIEFGVYLTLEEAERLSGWIVEEINKIKRGQSS